MVRKRNILILLAMVTLLLCGCSSGGVSDLYCLPKRSEEYTNLQSVLQSALANLEYSAPLKGDNQQTVQSVDLDGDGESEYVVFAQDNSDKPLQMLLFAGDGEKYELIDAVVSAGSDFDQVEYIEMDGRPGYEIVVGRQISNQVARSVSVFTYDQGKLVQLMSANYSEFYCCDLDEDGRSELLLLRSGETGGGIFQAYSLKDQGEIQTQEVSMSVAAENILRIVEGSLEDGVKAIYVASTPSGGNGIITDVFTMNGGVLNNISVSEDSGVSTQTMREYDIYASDIDGDGILELPKILRMQTADGAASTLGQYLIRWYSLRSDGTQVDKMFTYHNFVGGWYMELESVLVPWYNVTQKGSGFEFSLWSEGYRDSQKLMTLYVLTGQKREEQAIKENRFVLYRGDTIIYAANLEAISTTYNMTKESVIKAFHLIGEDGTGSD